jgi:CubicO group peptidase (beta-lactamase class C family)
MTKSERRMRNIENGLVAFKHGQKDTSQAQKHSLADRMAHYRIPGVSITLIHDYRIEWAKGYGVAQAGSATPVTKETVFQAASSTKLLTSMVVLRYVEKGQLDVDKDVNEYLKTWRVPDTEATRKEKVTLRRLLTHQSGFNRPDGGFSSDPVGSPSLVQILNGEAPAENQAACIEFVPGSEWQYSNMGFVLIQLILGVVIMANGARGDYLALELVPVVLAEYQLRGAL